MSGACDHFGLSIEQIPVLDLLKPVFEDRPGLLGAVSAGRSPPPEMAPRNASPLEIRGQKSHKRLDVAGKGDVEGCLYLFLSGLWGLPAASEGSAASAGGSGKASVTVILADHRLSKAPATRDEVRKTQAHDFAHLLRGPNNVSGGAGERRRPPGVRLLSLE